MKKQLTEEMIIDWWLKKYHNTTSKEVVEKHPELCKTPDWFKLYAVTQKQHDEWHEWMIEELRKYYGCSKKFARSHSWAIYLNLAPVVKKENEDKSGSEI